MSGEHQKAERIQEEWIRSKNVLALCTYHFKLEPKEHPTPGQCNIIKKIVFDGCKRLLLNCYTRYGKSHAIGLAIGLYIILNKDKKINLIAPTIDQTAIIREVFNRYAQRSYYIMRLIRTLTYQDMEKEESKKKLVFANGITMTLIGVNGKGNAAMGKGGDLNIVDEMGLIETKTFDEKVDRMLGDDAENSQMIGLFNPWPTENIAKDLWDSGTYEKIHIDWKQGVKEGRTTEAYIQEKKDRVDKVTFQVLYESKFPRITEDTILTPEAFDESTTRNVGEVGIQIDIGCDVARMGSDQTTFAIRRGPDVFHTEEHSKERTTVTTGRAINFIDFYLNKGFRVVFAVDDATMGGGVTDQVMEHYEGHHNRHKLRILPINNGSNAIEEDRYENRISELWLWIGDNIEDLRLPNDLRLKKELIKRKYKYTGKGKRILEPKEVYKKREGKSPDMADAVAYCFASETDDGYFEGEMPVFY